MKNMNSKPGDVWDEEKGWVSPHDRSNVVVNLRWSVAIPTVPGWYWSRNYHGREEIVHVVWHSMEPDELCIMENSHMGWHPCSIKNMGREWAGPIPMPEAN